MPTDLCPWLGLAQDREIRHAMPAEAHVCHAQKRTASIELDYQSRFCLTGDHTTCRFYREAPEPEERSVPISADPHEDQVLDAGRFPWLRTLFWLAALIVGLAVVYYYISGLASPSPEAAPSPSPSAAVELAPTKSPMPSPIQPLVDPSPAFAFSEPTATPTPYPGGAIYTLSPSSDEVGWVASDEVRGTHQGDSYLYSGVFQGVAYHGIFKIDLSPVPRGAALYSAALELTGLDARRLGVSGAWELRILEHEAGQEPSASSYQDVHNAAVRWTVPPVVGAGDVAPDGTNVFEFPRDLLLDLEQRLLDEDYIAYFRIDGPLTGVDSLFAWDSGYGAASRGKGPRLLLNVGAPPAIAIPSGTPPPTPTPTPTNTPEWVVVTNTPRPENALTAAVVALQVTEWARTTGTATATPEFVATATPDYVVVTNTPRPENLATAEYVQSVATANFILTGTPTATPHNLATATNTPRPTRTAISTATPVFIWLDEITPGPSATPTATPTATPAMPAGLEGKIAFMSDRSGEPEVYLLEPDSGRLALLTDRWPYDRAVLQDGLSPDGEHRTHVMGGDRGIQVYVTQFRTGISWAVTFAEEISYDPVWSPQGDLIAFVSQEMGPHGGADEIFTVNPQGRDKERLTFNTWEWDKHPSFSPDGSQIVFWSNQTTGLKQLWIMNVDGSKRRILLRSPYNDWDPVWIK